MSVWKKNYESLQAVSRISDALGLLDTIDTESLTESDLQNFARLQKALFVLKARMSALDPELFHQSGWGNLESWLKNLVTYVQEFAKTRNVSQLQNANNTLDEILAFLKPVDIPVSVEFAKALSEATTAFQQRLIDELEKLRGKSKDLEAQLTALNTAAQGTASELEALRNTIELQKGRLDQAIAEFQKQFSQAESGRATEFASANQRFQKEFESQTSQLKNDVEVAEEKRVAEWSTFMKGSKEASENFMSFFQQRQTEVNEIFGAIGSAALSGHFARTADHDGRAANVLRWAALGFMGLMIVVGGISFYQSLMYPVADWRVFLFRLGTIFVIAIPAVYAAQESSKHRKREQQNRKLQVELASIDAYLVQLPESKRHELKEKLTEKFFGQPDYIDQEEPVTRHQLFDLLSEVLRTLTKAK